MPQKNFGNLVGKYVSSDNAGKYEPIVAGSITEYRQKQLADLKRFLAEDYSEKVDNKGNPGDQLANLRGQKKEIETEIKRLESILATRDKVVKETVTEKPKKKKRSKK